ncbi:MAG: HDIG domain-containing protein [Bacteroidales bacterium]|nr:HDIG domain-containing protein [Bacteroidales bacterium]
MKIKPFLLKHKVAVAMVLLGVVMLVAYPQRGTFKYSYHTGGTWMYETLVAPFDFPILKTQEERLMEMEQKASEVLDYYEFESKVSDDRVASLKQTASSATSSADKNFILTTAAELQSIYDKGIIASADNNYLSDKVVFIKKGKRAVETAGAEIYTVDEAYSSLRKNIVSRFGEELTDSLFNALNIREYIDSNLSYDEATTMLVHRNAVDYVSPTSGVVYAGQLIVSRGEIVTKEINQMLDSYKAEYLSHYGYNDSRLSTFFSHVLFVMIMLWMLVCAIQLTESIIFRYGRQLTFIATLVMLVFLAIIMSMHVRESYRMIIPLAMYVIIAQSWLKPSTTYATYIVSLLPLLFMVDDGVELYFMNMIAGAILVSSSRFYRKTWSQFMSALLVFVGMFMVYAAYALASGNGFHRIEIFCMLGYALVLLAGYPLIFMFEKLFNYVSVSRLWELTDTSNPVLQEMSKKAPGTFQHSLQVASLAESACREIGGNPVITRVGGLYHDIGKIMNPLCFIENQTSDVDYHANLTPRQSAAAIIKHVDDGVALAKKNQLPDMIVNFIESHHGTSLTGYFYNKYCNEGGDPVDQAAFRYHGQHPFTKEQVVLMFADSIEAASRTLKSHDQESISKLVDSIIDAKIADGQIADAKISFREVAQVRESFKKFLQQIYHERIEYPKLKV